MTTERSLVSMSQLQILAERQPNLTMWMWGSQQPSSHRQEDSWEVRAFMDDAGNAAGATWPPRSYSCTFCRREFRSAQALGGHMNVHRRDRAKLRQGPQGLDVPSKTPSPPPPVNIGSLDIIRDVSIHSYQFMGPLGHDIDMRGKKNPNTVDINGDYVVMEEELDLELRLGR